MANNLTTTAPESSGKPTPDPLSRAVVGRCNSAIEEIDAQLRIASDAAPRPAERAALEARRDALREALAPAPPGEIKRLIAWLFTCCVAREEDDSDLEKQIANHVFVLRGQPVWAVRQVVTKWAQEEKFRPVPSELLARAQRAADAARGELWEILRLLNAKVYAVPSPGERARVAALFAGLAAQMAARAAPAGKGAPSSAPMDWPERERAILEKAREPLRLGPDLLAATLAKVREARNELAAREMPP